MRRFAIAFAVLAVGGALVFPSAAAPFAADSVGEDVQLAPSDGANGDYARLEDGELVVDLTATNPDVDGEGVNADGVTRLSEVFELRYNGSQYAHVWITHGSEDVTLTARGEPIQSEADNVTLAPNESVAVGIVVDTTGMGPTDGFVDDMEVNARVAEPTGSAGGQSQQSSDLDGFLALFDNDTETTVEQAGETGRSLRVTNPPTDGSTTVDIDRMALLDGGAVTLDELDLTASGETALALNLTRATPAATGDGVGSLAAVEVTESSGEVETATLRFSADRAFLDERGIAPEQLTVVHTSDGERSTLPVELVAERDGRVVFEAETPGFSTFTVAAFQPAIDVTDASLSTDAVGVNETATVTARLENDGRASGTRTVTLVVDGESVAERTVSLAPGESTTATFDLARSDPGEYEVRVDDADAGTLTVEAAAAPATEAETTTATRTAEPVEEPAGLGLKQVLGLTLLLTLVAATLLLARRAPR